VDATCALYAEMYSMTFSDADPSLGGAHTTRLANDRLLGVRAPMNEAERPVTRPYILVDDIEAALAAAGRAGAEITVPPMSIPGHGTCAIIYQSGIESGLWQL
jgi:predicted enzyme related to lactoylglutathione lyase